ncbi:MAG: hypothetical protein UX89_C0001G0021 [Parcubacteria group bacterium GW2011_GWA2_47_16]|nr:MAG: hypothetical protein UX89_C0001G0021 [Parcubacteria group bacterium GW2011_GWA2_47_16]
MEKLLIIFKRYFRLNSPNSPATLIGYLLHIKNRAKRDLYSLFCLFGKSKIRFEGHYTAWRSRRILTILDEYGHRYFDGKTALEVGAGYGDIGTFFRELGCKITFLEGLASNVRMIKKRHPFIPVVRWDLNKGLPPAHYDIVFHFGTLYHLTDPEYALREACRHCDCLILETGRCRILMTRILR